MTAGNSTRPSTLASDAVVIDAPAALRSLRLLRLAVADAAADLDLDIDMVDSARIAIDELAALLLASGEWERLVVTIHTGAGVLEATGELRGPKGDPQPVEIDGVVRELLNLCVDRYELSEEYRFSFVLSGDRRARPIKD